MRIQSVVLENHRDIAILGGHIIDQLVADVQFAVGNLFQTGDHAQGGGLTATGRSDKNDELLVFDLQSKVRYCGHAASVDLINVLQGKACHMNYLLLCFKSRNALFIHYSHYICYD